MAIALALAGKDIRLLLRNRGALFFTLAWPLLIAVFFGLVFGGGGASSPLKIALVIEAASAEAEEFATGLAKLEGIVVDRHPASEAETLVRQGKRVAAVVLPAAFADQSAGAFAGSPPTIHLWMDPSRRAERAMLEGQLMKVAAEAMFASIEDPQRRKAFIDDAQRDLAGAPEDQQKTYAAFFESLDAVMANQAKADTSGGAGKNSGFTPLQLDVREVSAARRGPVNGFAVSFTQGMFWALLGALMSFVTSLVMERMQGTWNRLRVSPVGAGTLLFGKSLACYAVMMASLGLIAVVGALVFAVVPSSWTKLILAFACAGIAFTGLMMLLASIGRTIQSASGAAWALMMPMAMIGGAMIPLFAMPSWMLALSDVSPVKWTVLAIEGAMWRGFSLAEMAPALVILVTTGLLAGSIGVYRIGRASWN